MKKYNQFITERITVDTYLFVVVIKDKSHSVIEPFISYLKEYIKLTRTEEDKIYSSDNVGILFKIYYKDDGKFNVHFITDISAPMLYSNFDNVKNTIELEDFMKVGFDGVEEFIKLNQDVNTYNL